MSKSIKISEQVYQELLLMQLPRESFSSVIERLLTLRHLLDKVAPLIRGSAEFRKWQEEHDKQATPAHG